MAIAWPVIRSELFALFLGAVHFISSQLISGSFLSARRQKCLRMKLDEVNLDCDNRTFQPRDLLFGENIFVGWLALVCGSYFFGRA